MRLVGFLRKNSTNPNDKDNLLRLFEYTDNFDRVNYLANIYSYVNGLPHESL